MRTRTALALLALSAVAAIPCSRAQLADLSFTTDTYFQDDGVDTSSYFHLPPDSTAHFDLRFDPQHPRFGGDFARIRVMGGDGSLIFDEKRGLDWVSHDDRWYSLQFTSQRSTGPVERRFYENLVLEMWITPGWWHEDGYYVPPEIDIDNYSELYVAGYSPMVQYVPPGYSGFYQFGPSTRDVTYALVPVPEPSTYAAGAMLFLAGVIGWRWRRTRAAGGCGRQTMADRPSAGRSE